MKFRLQRVLDLRHAQEKIAQQELATRQQDYQAILGRLDQLLEDESTLFELIKRQEGSSIYLPKIQHLYTYSAAVSYTHLDVYKRQPPDHRLYPLVPRFRPGSHSGCFFWVGGCLKCGQATVG